MLILGETLLMWGQGVYEKHLYLPLNFTVNLKLLYKIKEGKKMIWKSHRNSEPPQISGIRSALYLRA